MGKYVERGDQTTRALDMSYERLLSRDTDSVATVHWHVLLRSVSGNHAYRSCHPAASTPRDIATFLLYNREFPRAVARCIERIAERLGDIECIQHWPPHERLEKARRDLEFCLESGPGSDLTPRRLHIFLDLILSALAELTTRIGKAYFGHG